MVTSWTESTVGKREMVISSIWKKVDTRFVVEHCTGQGYGETQKVAK